MSSQFIGLETARLSLSGCDFHHYSPKANPLSYDFHAPIKLGINSKFPRTYGTSVHLVPSFGRNHYIFY